MNLRVFFFWLSIFIAACALPACSRGSGKLRLAFVSNNAHGFWTYAEAGCKAAAEELDIELTFRRPSEGTPVAQTKLIEELLDKGIKGIAVSPNDPKNFVTFLKSVNKKVPLVMADNDLPDMDARRCYIGTHNYKAGRALGALIRKSFPKGGKIVIFVGQMDAPNAVERRQGVLDYLAGIEREEIHEPTTPAEAKNHKVGDYILIDTITDTSKEVVCQRHADEFLDSRAGAEADCLVGLWEYNPPAILRAVRDSKLAKKPKIAAFDENYVTMEGIESGEIIGSVVQNPYKFGYESIKILAGLARGDESVLQRKDIDSQKRIYIPHRVIVKTVGDEKIGGSETISVDVFFPELKKLKAISGN